VLKKIVIGSRGSDLALWQSKWVISQLEKIYPQTELKLQVIKTEGDKILDTALSKIGDKGLFTKALEDALIEGSIDIAVHSLKDVPTLLPNGLGIAAVSRREDPRDVFISLKHNSLDELPEGATIATGSLRRKCQLLNFRADFNIKDIRGNINTRIKKLEESGWDAMILAFAGIKRLGLDKYIKQIIPEDIILPAVGQGVIALETRLEDTDVNKMAEPLNNSESMYQAAAERSLLKTVEGGCQVPVGVFTKISDEVLSIDAMIGSIDGTKVIKCKMEDNIRCAEELGKRAGLELLQRGGREILQKLH